jgi:hypothetical protein
MWYQFKQTLKGSADKTDKSICVGFVGAAFLRLVWKTVMLTFQSLHP